MLGRREVADVDEALLVELRGLTTRRGVTRYQALADGIAAAIAAGRLAVDDRLPAERGLARTLGVSRNTVVAAYDDLRARGLVHTRQGSGTVVDRGASPVTSPQEAALVGLLRPRAMLHGLSDTATVGIDMRGAYWAGTKDLPPEVFQVDIRDFSDVADGCGYWPAGLPALRESIAEHLSRDCHLPTTPEQLMITSGAQQAITLLATAVIEPGAKALVEQFSYAGAIEALTVARARLHGVALTDHGVELNALHAAVRDHNPRLVYLVASCQNPTGSVLPVHARRRLAQMAEDWDTVVVEDTSLALTQFRGDEIPPPIAAFAQPGGRARLITVGSLSKIAWAGLRIGWIRAARPESIERLTRLRTSMDLGVSIPAQIIARNVYERIDEIAARRRELLAARYEVLADLMGRHLRDWTWDAPRGGLNIWAHLPVGSAVEFAIVAAEHGVEVVAGSNSSPGNRGRSSIRVPFGQSAEVLEDAVERLGLAWQQYRRELRTREVLDVPTKVMRDRARAVALADAHRRQLDDAAALAAGVESLRPPT
jgi:DNA-binding transcriptional MocR family regulator